MTETQTQPDQTHQTSSEYKWNWKKEFKDSFKRMLSELFSLVCISITLVIVVFTQTDQQLQAVASVINSRNWVVAAMILIGLLAMSVVVEKILKIVFWLVGTPLKWLFRKWKNRKQRHPMSI